MLTIRAAARPAPMVAARPAVRRAAARGVVKARADPKTPLESAIDEAKETCADGSSSECAVAWDTVRQCCARELCLPLRTRVNVRARAAAGEQRASPVFSAPSHPSSFSGPERVCVSFLALGDLAPSQCAPVPRAQGQAGLWLAPRVDGRRP